jgi:phosphomevalonate kinase
VVPAEVAALAWPADLAMGVVWTGRSADTASLTAGVAAARARRPAAFAAVDADLAVLADQGLTAFGAGRTAEFLQTVRDYDRALHGLGRLAGADIVSGIHRRVGDEAEALGLAYKPAGAGSGDIGVAFGSPAAVTRLKSRLPGLGATLLPLRPGAPGLTVRHE